MSAKLGHSSDGSNIQNHSIGKLYPQIIGYREGRLDHWFVLSTDGKESYFVTEEDAEQYAHHLNFKAKFKND